MYIRPRVSQVTKCIFDVALLHKNFFKYPFSFHHFLMINGQWSIYLYQKLHYFISRSLTKFFDAQNLRYCCFHKRRICLTFHQHKMVLEPLISINQVLQIGYYANKMVKKSWWFTISVVICIYMCSLHFWHASNLLRMCSYSFGVRYLNWIRSTIQPTFKEPEL